MKRLDTLHPFLFLAPLAFLFVLPGILFFFPVIDEQPLAGVQQEIAPVPLSLSSLRDQSWQQSVTAQLRESLPLRNSLIRTDNQLYWSLFRDISPDRPVRLVRGDDNYLFEQAYLDELSDQRPVSREQIRSQLAAIEVLEERLAEQDIPLIFLIAPSKAVTEMDRVPAAWNDTTATTNYERLVEELNDFDITVFDTTPFFEEIKKTTHPLFPWSGTHWTYYGACLTMRELVSSTTDVAISCELGIQYDYPIGIDQDLASYLNQWVKPVPPEPVFFPTVSVDGDLDHIFFAGDSFLWNLTALFDGTPLYNDRTVAYYNETLYERTGVDELRTRSMNSVPVDELQTILLHSDLVIIEVTHTGIHNIAGGFAGSLSN